MARHVRVLDALGQCVPFRDSAYAAEVLADSPVAYWQYQECEGLPIDSSGNGYDMTTTTGTDRAYRGYGKGPLYPPETRDRHIVEAGGSYFSRNVVTTVVDDWTLEMWFLPLILNATDQVILYNGGSGTNGWGLMGNYAAGVSKLKALAGGVAGGTLSSTALTDDVWYHVVLRRESGTWKYFLNGVDDGTAGTFAPNTPTGSVLVGGGLSVQRGQAHIAVYDTALSDARIAAHYAAA